MYQHQGRRRSVSTALLPAVAVTAVLTACASGDAEPAASTALPSDHVHAVAVNPGDDHVYLATHEGLFDLGGARPERVGPVIDLMGFTVAGPDHFYASGHPGPGTDLPQPVGLLESTDGGLTWTPLSRGGESDFHALTASTSGVAGFDGAVRTSADGVTWGAPPPPPAAPFDLAASPGGAALLATTEEGLLRSDDVGATWSAVEGTPLLLLVEWADTQTAVGVTPEGAIVVSDDGAKTWEQVGDIGTSPQALGVQRAASGDLRVLVVTGSAVLESLDGGTTFTPLAAGS